MGQISLARSLHKLGSWSTEDGVTDSGHQLLGVGDWNSGLSAQLLFHVAVSPGKTEPWSTRGSIAPAKRLWGEARTSTIRSLSADPGPVPGPGFSWVLSAHAWVTPCPDFTQEVITKLPWACSCRGASCSQNYRVWAGLIWDWYRVGARKACQKEGFLGPLHRLHGDNLAVIYHR